MPKAYHLALVYHEGAAFFSIVNKLMCFVQKYQPVAAVSWHVNFPFNIYGEGETFGKVFEPYFDPTYENYDIETIICDHYFDQSLTGTEVAKLYTEETCRKQTKQSMDWRLELHGYWNTYFKIHNPEILEKFEIFKSFVDMEKQEGKTIITMLVRHLAHANEQENGVYPNFQLFDNEIEKIAGGDLNKVTIICMTDSMEAFTYFKKKYENYNIQFPHTERQWAYEPQTAFSSGTEARICMAMLSVLYLTTGDYFIHAVSNMSTAVMYINPQIKNIYLVGA